MEECLQGKKTARNSFACGMFSAKATVQSKHALSGTLTKAEEFSGQEGSTTPKVTPDIKMQVLTHFHENQVQQHSLDREVCCVHTGSVIST